MMSGKTRNEQGRRNKRDRERKGLSTDGSHARQVGEASAFATGDRVTFDTAQEQKLAALLFKA